MKSRLPKGMGGGPKDMNSMIRQAQKMQEEMEIKQAELAEREFTASVSGGMVEITMTGNKEVKQIHLDPEIVDPEDIEMLEDLLAAAFNQVTKEIETTSNAEMDKITDGLSIPGMA